MSEQEKLSRDEKFRLLASQVAQHEEERTNKSVHHHKSENLTHDSEPDEPEEPVKESSKPSRQLPERPVPKKKNIVPLLVVIIVFLLVVIAAAAFILFGKGMVAGTGPEAQLTVEPAAEPPVTTTVVTETVVPVPKTGVQLTVPSEYALYGRTEYDLTEQAYQQLLTSVHQYIEGQISNFTKYKDPYYQQFESISVNDDCSVYAIVVNDAMTRTPKERSVPEQLVFYSEMYAAYTQQKVETVSVEYWTLGGTMLSRDSYVPGAQQGEASQPITEGQQAGVTQNQTPGMTEDQQVGVTDNQQIGMPASQQTGTIQTQTSGMTEGQQVGMTQSQQIGMAEGQQAGITQSQMSNLTGGQTPVG